MERPDTYNTSRLVDGYRQAFVDSETEAEPDFTPRFVSNSNGTTVKSVIENELKDCSSMFMSVAFITSGGIAPFPRFPKRIGVKGSPRPHSHDRLSDVQRPESSRQIELIIKS